MSSISNSLNTVIPIFPGVLMPQASKNPQNQPPLFSFTPPSKSQIDMLNHSSQSAFTKIEKIRNTAASAFKPYAFSQSPSSKNSHCPPSVDIQINPTKTTILKTHNYLLSIEKALDPENPDRFKLFWNDQSYDEYTIKNNYLKTKVTTLDTKKSSKKSNMSDVAVSNLYTSNTPPTTDHSVETQLERWRQLKSEKSISYLGSNYEYIIIGKKPYFDGNIRIKVNGKTKSFQTKNVNFNEKEKKIILNEAKKMI